MKIITDIIALELAGSWNGTNCGVDDEAPTPARLEMQPDGFNIWYFNDIPQAGDGVEAVVGWHCIGVGIGYWWGQVANSNVTWCNLFQYSHSSILGDGNIEEDVYINWAYGGEGQFAEPKGFCPTHLDTNPDLLPLQATFVRAPSSNGDLSPVAKSSSNSVMSSCNVPASRPIEEQPRCHSLFVAHGLPIPDPFGTRTSGDGSEDEKDDERNDGESVDMSDEDDDEAGTKFLSSLPAIDKVTCKAIPPAEEEDKSLGVSYDPFSTMVLPFFAIVSLVVPMLVM